MKTISKIEFYVFLFHKIPSTMYYYYEKRGGKM